MWLYLASLQQLYWINHEALLLSSYFLSTPTDSGSFQLWNTQQTHLSSLLLFYYSLSPFTGQLTYWVFQVSGHEYMYLETHYVNIGEWSTDLVCTSVKQKLLSRQWYTMTQCSFLFYYWFCHNFPNKNLGKSLSLGVFCSSGQPQVSTFILHNHLLDLLLCRLFSFCGAALHSSLVPSSSSSPFLSFLIALSVKM